jgi:hypothetical protein
LCRSEFRGDRDSTELDSKALFDPDPARMSKAGR